MPRLLISACIVFAVATLVWIAGHAGFFESLLAGTITLLLVHFILERPLHERLRELQTFITSSAQHPTLALRKDNSEVEDLVQSVLALRERANRAGLSDIKGRALAEQIVDQMNEAVAVIDRQRVVVQSNIAFRRVAASQEPRCSLLEALSNPEMDDAVRDVLWLGRTQKLEFPLAVSGLVRTFQAELGPIIVAASDEQPTTIDGVLLVMRDLTEMRRNEAIRRDFVTNASHELRTPLTSIRGFSETLLSGALQTPNAERFVQNIHSASLRLSLLVDDMLQLARAEAPDAQFAVETLNVAQIAREVLHELEGSAAGKQLRLVDQIAAELWLPSNRSALETIVANLVSNAVKYSKENGLITVSLRQERQQLILTVSDTGHGIAPEQLPRIFERFYRVDAGRSRQEGGTGLGLAIVKHLVERLDGKIQVESTIDAGSCFMVILPLS